jgi:hypothetical protein
MNPIQASDWLTVALQFAGLSLFSIGAASLTIFGLAYL